MNNYYYQWNTVACEKKCRKPRTRRQNIKNTEIDKLSENQNLISVNVDMKLLKGHKNLIKSNNTKNKLAENQE